MNHSFADKKLTRRNFLATAGTAVALPTILPLSVFGRDNRPAPSGRIVMGVVGCGGMGNGNTDAFLGKKECQVVAACDVDKNHLRDMVNKVNGRYKNQDCKGYSDLSQLMARTDIDAVMLALPDHWHALAAVEAANHGKDIYGEKPLARTIVEQQSIVRAVQKNKRIWQTGSWQRSQSNFHKAAEIVRNGLIGKIKRVEVGLPDGPFDHPELNKPMPGTTPPPELDYDRWIGPSTLLPYIEQRTHYQWRWNYNTGGGQLLDWIGHHCDIAHWGMDCDRSGPLEIEGRGEFPPKDAVWNSCTKYRIELKYPNDIEMTIGGGQPDIQGGAKWIGTDGWVRVDRGVFESSKAEWRDYNELPEELRKVKLYKSTDHHQNFLDCVKSRQPTVTPAETAHHSAIPGHLGLISMLVGRKLKWDSSRERIIGDPEASKLMGRDYRAPWKLA
ncbi:MAG: gfo/Idh/MocA family oxidoreductase [Verrucomicrobia bacterium]|nr:MAG: gfo/Idh/MocA family oxidoreductase [Verrucomicrobiota bacterium]